MDDHDAHHYRAHTPPDLDQGDQETIYDRPNETRESGEEAEVGDDIKDELDVESRPNQLERLKSTKSVKDANLVHAKPIVLATVLTYSQVSWDGPDDPENPKNWRKGKKWAATLIVSSFTFISPVSSSMVAPALNTIAQELHVTTEIEQSLILSIFVLAYAIGPLFLGPLSEVYGRVIVLQLANLFYLAFNIGCGFATTKAQLITFRLLSGLGGSAPLVLGGGVLSDVFRAEERGRAISIYSLAPLLGPAVGPIAGGFIAENTTWRWVFWSTSIVDAGIQILGFFFLRETYPPALLSAKAKKMRKESGNDALHTEWETPDRTLGKVLRTSLIRPFRLLGTQVIMQVLALYMAYIYGLVYLVLSTFPTVWENAYGESIGIGGLNYISLGIGFFLGTQACAPITDRIYRRLKMRNGNVGRPEFRVPLMVPGALLVPAGLFIYGWTSFYKTHWIGPNIGSVIFAAGTIIGYQCTQIYIVDAYSRYAASAIGAATVLRSLAGFGFPLFAPYMYSALGLGWGNSLLGFVAIGLGIPAPFMLWKFGQALRDRSPYAAG
jgi:multidrug resistance protein